MSLNRMLASEAPCSNCSNSRLCTPVVCRTGANCPKRLRPHQPMQFAGQFSLYWEVGLGQPNCALPSNARLAELALRIRRFDHPDPGA
jgi:hypothetical protein